MEFTPLLNWSLAALFAVVALQSLFLIVVVLGVNRRLRRIDRQSRQRLKGLASFLTAAEENLVRVHTVTSRFTDWESPVREAAEAAARALSDVDEKSERALSYLETNLEQWQARSDELIVRFSTASDEVYHAVLQPASRVSLVLSAVGAGLKQLLSDPEAEEDPSHYHQDQQIFI